MRLIYALIMFGALVIGYGATLAITQLSQLEPRSVTHASPAVSFTNIGTIETHNADADWFVYARTHFFPIDGARQVRTRITYDETTTFVRQVARMQDGIYYSLSYEPADPIDVLQAGNEVVAHYTTNTDGSLHAFYVMSGAPLFASY